MKNATVYIEEIQEDSLRNHCLNCQYFSLDINQEPCNECLHSGEVPGRDRPLFTPKKHSKAMRNVQHKKGFKRAIQNKLF